MGEAIAWWQTLFDVATGAPCVVSTTLLVEQKHQGGLPDLLFELRFEGRHLCTLLGFYILDVAFRIQHSGGFEFWICKLKRHTWAIAGIHVGSVCLG